MRINPLTRQHDKSGRQGHLLLCHRRGWCAQFIELRETNAITGGMGSLSGAFQGSPEMAPNKLKNDTAFNN